MSSQSNTDSKMTNGNRSRKGQQSGSRSTIPTSQTDGRQVPSPYVELYSVASVSSEYGVSSPYTNQSSYSASPYPNPASNVEIPHTPFNIHEDNLLSQEKTYQTASTNLNVPSPVPATANAKKRNSESGNATYQLLNGNGVCFSNENSGPSGIKKSKTIAPLEFKESLFADVIALENKYLKRNDAGNENVERSGTKDNLRHAESIAKQLQNNGLPMNEDESNVENLPRNDLLTDEDVAKANPETLDALLLRQTMEETARVILNTSYEIGPETPVSNVQSLTNLVNRMIPALTREFEKLPRTPVSSTAGVVATNSATGNRHPFPVSFYNSGEYGLPSPSPSPTLLSIMEGGENGSRNRFSFPQGQQDAAPSFQGPHCPQSNPCLRTNSVRQNATTATRPMSRSTVVDALGSVHSIGLPDRNNLLAGLPNFNSSTVRFTSSTDINQVAHFRPERGIQFSQSNRISSTESTTLTFHAAASNSVPAKVQSQRSSQEPPPHRNLQGTILPQRNLQGTILPQRNLEGSFPPPRQFQGPPRIPLQGNQARAPHRIQIRVGNNLYSFTHNEWAEISDSPSVPKMTKTIFDKLFSLDERLNSTVSGRKSKSALPGLNHSRMVALYACVAFLRKHPNRFPSGPIDASVYTLDDNLKKQIKTIMSQKLNATKQQFSRRQEIP